MYWRSNVGASKVGRGGVSGITITAVLPLSFGVVDRRLSFVGLCGEK